MVKVMEKYKSKYTEHIVGAPAWSVVDNHGNTLATFKTTTRFDGEARAKQLAAEMNREVMMADIRTWREEIERAQRNVNKVAVALVNIKDMICLKKKDLPGKFDPKGELVRLRNAMSFLKLTVDELPSAEDIEKAQEILSSLTK